MGGTGSTSKDFGEFICNFVNVTGTQFGHLGMYGKIVFYIS